MEKLKLLIKIFTVVCVILALCGAMFLFVSFGSVIIVAAVIVMGTKEYLSPSTEEEDSE
jgi:hypothetical protein|tara:strand:- start:586 stop:762 length:177 start_codon:yes stop_codon:yes gene_type:complete